MRPGETDGTRSEMGLSRTLGAPFKHDNVFIRFKSKVGFLHGLPALQRSRLAIMSLELGLGINQGKPQRKMFFVGCAGSSDPLDRSFPLFLGLLQVVIVIGKD